MIDKIGKSILTMFGIGYFKYAPGTAASFLTCIIWFTIDEYTKFPFRGSGKIFVLVFLIALLVYSIILIDKLYNKNDAREIVIDEFIGQSIPIISYYYFQFFVANDSFKNATIFFNCASILLNYFNW